MLTSIPAKTRPAAIQPQVLEFTSSPVRGQYVSHLKLSFKDALAGGPDIRTLSAREFFASAFA